MIPGALISQSLRGALSYKMPPEGGRVPAFDITGDSMFALSEIGKKPESHIIKKPESHFIKKPESHLINSTHS